MASATDQYSDTRMFLLEAACQRIAETPLAELPAAQIAHRAGVASGTFYLYFKNKHEIAMSVTQSCLDQLREVLTQDDSLGGQLRSLRAFVAAGSPASKILFTPGLLGPAFCVAIRKGFEEMPLPRCAGGGPEVERLVGDLAIRAVIWNWAAGSVRGERALDDAEASADALERIIESLIARGGGACLEPIDANLGETE